MRFLAKMFPAHQHPEISAEMQAALAMNKKAKGDLLHKTSRAVTDMTAIDQWGASLERRHFQRAAKVH